LNSGAALYVSGFANSIQQGIDLARQAIDTGMASKKMSELVALTNDF